MDIRQSSSKTQPTKRSGLEVITASESFLSYLGCQHADSKTAVF